MLRKRSSLVSREVTGEPEIMTSRNNEPRNVAEQLLASSNSQYSNLRSPQQYGYPVYPNLPDLPHSHSLNTISSYVLTEDLVAGQRYNGSMSNVRRFFCLFVTFDLLFTCLMWLICITLAGENLIPALQKQVLHYNVHTSLFDIVMAAVCRFTVLLLFYALLYINHWIIIALSTSGTCAFLIAKVFVYDWSTSPQPVFQVLLILTSFVLSWSEAWFLDFKVIPQELLARNFFLTSPENDRAPLVRSFLDGLQSGATESVGNFYSPMGSPTGSAGEEEVSVIHPLDREGPIFIPSANFADIEEEEIKNQGRECLETAWSLLHSPDWKLERQNIDGDIVYSMSQPRAPKIFKITGIVNFPPRFLLDELFYNIEEFPKWNPAVIEAVKIQAIDDHTDINYVISAEGGGGLVSSRDFVNLRHWDVKESCYISAARAFNHPSIPPHKKYIRGENGVSCWVMEPIENESQKCKFHWLLNSDLKGWIPQKILDMAYISVLFDYINCLRLYSISLHDSGKLPLEL